MPTDARFGVANVRAAVKRRVVETSLRETASEVGMSFSGLRSFLDGRTPQPRTRKKLVAWYVQSRERTASRALRHDVNAAIELLAGVVNSTRDPGAQRVRLKDIVSRLHAAAGVPPERT